MFRPSGLFKTTTCPRISTCSLQNCLFSHQAAPPPPPISAPNPPVIAQAPNPAKNTSQNERSATPPPPKRRRIDGESSSKSTEVTSNSAKPTIKSILKKPTPSNSNNGVQDSLASSSPLPPYIPPSSIDTEDGRYFKIETTDKKTGLVTKTRVEKAGPSKILQSHAPIASSSRIASTSVQGIRALHTSPTQKTTAAVTTAATVAPKKDVTNDLLNWGKPKTPVTNKKAPEPERLVPRMVSRPPEQFETRLKVLTKLHEQYVRLDPQSQSNATNKQKLIKRVRDEEEEAALKHSKAYLGVMRNRIYALTKMSLQDYKKENDERLKEERQKEAADGGEVVDTGMTPEDEARAIENYVHSAQLMKEYDYVMTPPSEQEIANSKAGVQVAAGDEECERCKSRFKMFPDGDLETGLYSSGGKCVHHWGKAWVPDKTIGQRQWHCCHQAVGETAGCTDHHTHVFLIKSPPRLASQWQFVETPAPLVNSNKLSAKKGKERAVCLDCEMGFTTHGFELIRLTATRFPNYEPIIDILVQPFGKVLDLNTRFSGVTQEQWDSAPEYSAEKANEAAADVIAKAASPSQARDILFQHIDATSILIGHSLENDMKCLRVIHPRVVDTAILYMHRQGVGFRYSLKMLVKNNLGRFIQALDNNKGHDSKEDANEAGNLVRKRLMKDIKAGKVGKDGVWVASANFQMNAAVLKEGTSKLAETLKRPSERV
ncbi:RNA exonuclease 3 [Orbilia ellipsospora]|uniref:RNA exonuclease 3 n=1 Tax=Orbilia ellipsospora TaxID=2528407 RepID=A0AAV9WZA1_9PEZI